MDEFFPNFADWAAVTCYGSALIGCVYALVAAWVARRSARSDAPATPASFPAVTILKPLHGIEPDLYDNLAGFCVQD